MKENFIAALIVGGSVFALLGIPAYFLGKLPIVLMVAILIGVMYGAGHSEEQ